MSLSYRKGQLNLRDTFLVNQHYRLGMCLCYSVFPNISGTFGVRPYVDWSGCSGAFSQWRDGGNQEKGVSLVQEITSNRITDFNASSVSSLYQNDLTEVRVNALFGMYLIRSYEV